jgi:DNA-binding beta-propeller fold protein YncE
MKFNTTRSALFVCATTAATLLVAVTPGLIHAWETPQSSLAGASPASDRRPRIDFLGEWGTRGEGPSDLNLAVAIAADARGLVYIADAGSGFLHKFTVDGHPLLAFDDPRVSNPVAIAVDSDGEIYTADGRSGRVMVFGPTGDADHEQRAGGLGHFRVPLALAVDGDENLYVADAGLGAVAEYNERGRFVRVVAQASAGTPRVRTPVALAVSPDGSVFVADGSTSLISKFSARGEFLGTIGQPGAAVRTKNPVSLAASDHFLFCFDAAPPRLLVWTLDGKPYFEMDLSSRIALSTGTADTRASLAYVPPDGLLLLDPSSGKVLRFRTVF